MSLNSADFETWVANQLEAYSSLPPTPHCGKAEATYIASCSRCHQVNGLEKPDGSAVISRPDLYVYSGAAPNLTHLMTRVAFAGANSIC